jgi:hypothetical protein
VSVARLVGGSAFTLWASRTLDSVHAHLLSSAERARISGHVAAVSLRSKMKHPAKKITVDVPAEWGNDELSMFLGAAFTNVFASFALLPSEYKKAREVDDALLLLCANLTDAGDWFAPLFALKSHSCYRAASGLAMAGQSPEAFMVMRGALESALYGLYIHKNEGALEIWLKRNDGPEEKKKMKFKFTIANMWKYVKTADEQILDVAQAAYDKTIEFGGHPNPASVAAAVTMSKNPKGAQFKLTYLSKDTENINGTMKSVAQIGVTVLKVFGLVFPKRYGELGLPEKIEELCVGL